MYRVRGGLCRYCALTWLNVEQHRLRRVRTWAGREYRAVRHCGHQLRPRVLTALSFHPSPQNHRSRSCSQSPCRLPLRPVLRRR